MSLRYIYIYGTVSAKIAPRLKCYKNASRLNRYNVPTDNAIDFLFSTLHNTPLHYEVLKIGSRYRYPLGRYSVSNAMHFYNILTVGQFSRKLSHISYKNHSRLNRYNFRTVHAIDFLFSTLHTTPFLYGKILFGVLHLLRACIATSDTPQGMNPS